ncbi:MAG: thioredoxin-disulfide reductase [Candidatus Saganbacteria bacterium]|nr:thioredoxin-disulfide reductase [Candidatus Saganbacteria bacterium]
MPSPKLRTKPQTEVVIVHKDEPTDVIIIGGGPAGLTAAIYATRAGLKTTIIERALLGGMITTTGKIENYPGFPEGISGQELGQRMEEQAKKLGANIVYGSVSKISNGSKNKKVEIDSATTDGHDKAYEAKSIIIASGTSSKKTGIPGEKKLTGRGVSYCAVCDGPFYKDKQVMVIGGENAAIEEALFLSNIAAKVFVVYKKSTLNADSVLATRANLDPKIYFIGDSVLKEIHGTQKVTEAVIKNLKTGQASTIPIDGIFFYAGSAPNVSFFGELIKLDKDGFIITDEDMKTSVPGIFAAGDVRAKHLRQVSTAVADGAIAAVSAKKYLDNE